MTLKMKTALITGGGTGIGLASAIALKTQGAEIIICGRRRDVLEAAAEAHGFRALEMDVSEESSVVAAFEAAGEIDILVANAGIARGQNILGSDTAFWRQIMATNLDGAYLTIREALRRMPVDRYGRIIAISSIAGLRGLKGAHAYTASKHGLVGLIRALAADFAGKPVTFNAICPGYVATPIIDENVARLRARLEISEEAALALMTRENPHGRLIAPEEIAAAVCHLASPAAASINGIALEISGGA